jgi:hypothetical protein
MGILKDYLTESTQQATEIANGYRDIIDNDFNGNWSDEAIQFLKDYSNDVAAAGTDELYGYFDEDDVEYLGFLSGDYDDIIVSAQSPRANVRKFGSDPDMDNIDDKNFEVGQQVQVKNLPAKKYIEGGDDVVHGVVTHAEGYNVWVDVRGHGSINAWKGHVNSRDVVEDIKKNIKRFG